MHQSTVGFVDNNNNVVTREDNGPPLENLLQQSAQKWERLLYATGGTLELSKCFTYSVKWEHEAGMHRMKADQKRIR